MKIDNVEYVSEWDIYNRVSTMASGASGCATYYIGSWYYKDLIKKLKRERYMHMAIEVGLMICAWAALIMYWCK